LEKAEATLEARHGLALKPNNFPCRTEKRDAFSIENNYITPSTEQAENWGKAEATLEARHGLALRPK
jgi:hypothetical protein